MSNSHDLEKQKNKFIYVILIAVVIIVTVFVRGILREAKNTQNGVIRIEQHR